MAVCGRGCGLGFDSDYTNGFCDPDLSDYEDKIEDITDLAERVKIENVPIWFEYPLGKVIEINKNNLDDDGTPANDVNTLAVLENNADEARVDLDISWKPESLARNDVGDKIRWKIEKRAGTGPVQNWTTQTDGDFTSQDTHAVRSSAFPLVPSGNSEFTVTAWIDKDGNSQMDANESHRMLNLTIPEIRFKENPNSNYYYGYDEVSGEDDIYLSIDKNRKQTKVDFEIVPFVPNSFWAVEEGRGRFEVQGGPLLMSSETTEINITSLNTGGPRESEELRIVIGNDAGDVVKKLDVKLYELNNMRTLNLYAVHDGRSPKTTIQNVNNIPGSSEIKTGINKIFKQGIVFVTDVTSDMNKNLPYDNNNNGLLDIYRGGDNDEINALSSLNTGPAIAFVNDLRLNYRLRQTASANDYMIRIVNAKQIGEREYFIGDGLLREPITVTDVDSQNNEITIQRALINTHPTTDTIYQEDVVGLSSDPQLVALRSSSIIKVVAHEMLHKEYLGSLKDIAETDNIMCWRISSDTLRFRGQTVVLGGVGTVDPNANPEYQWEKILRRIIQGAN